MLRISEGKKLAKYALVGGLNTGVDFAVFCILVYGVGMSSIWAQALSYTSGVVNSYLLNRYWTFKVKEKMSVAEILRFSIINVISFGAATAVLLGLEQWGVSSAIAKIASVAFSLAVNYIGYRIWVFSTGMEQSGKRAH